MIPRSFLFVPGDAPRKIDRAQAGDAEALIFDLEDAVGPDAKPQARKLTAAALDVPAPMMRLVRVNAFDTGLTEDDVAATAGAADGWMLPKALGPEDVDRLAELTARQGSTAPILPLATETAAGVLSLVRRPWRHERLMALTWGAEDLAADLGALTNRHPDTGDFLAPFNLARELLVFAAAEAGVPAIDTVYIDFRNADGLSAEARETALMGFQGKLAIHPGQIDRIHAAYAPTPEQVDWATKVTQAVAEARGSVVSVDGRMIDRPHVRLAERILARRR